MTKDQIAKKKQATMKRIANETDAQRAKRLGPVRKIVRFTINPGKKSRVAHLACGHHRTTDFSTRKSYRCRACLLGKKVVKKAVVKKAVKKVDAATKAA